MGRTGVSIPPFKVHHFLLFHRPLHSIALFVRGTMATAAMCKIAVALGAADVKRTRARRFRDQQDPPGILALVPDFYYAREIPRHYRANLRMSGLEGGVRIAVRGPVLSPDEGKTRIYFERRSKFSLAPFVRRRPFSRSSGLGRGNRHCCLRLC